MKNLSTIDKILTCLFSFWIFFSLGIGSYTISDFIFSAIGIENPYILNYITMIFIACIGLYIWDKYKKD